MTLEVSAPAVASAFAGVTLLAMIPLAFEYRDVPGAVGWIGLLGATGGWALTYGVALTVLDPALRELFEIPQYLAMTSAVVFLVVAGLNYTGFRGFVRSRWMAGLIGLAGAFWLLIATNALGLHALVWRSYAVEPVLGAAAVSFEPTPLFYLIVAVAYVAIAAMVVLVFETMLRYKPLYRRRVALLLIAGVPVGAANVLWLANLTWPAAGIGPLGTLDLTPIAFLITALVDGYVIYTEDFFDVAPATSRIAESVAFDDLSTAVVLVNTDELVVGLNAPAAELFDVEDRDDALETPYSELTRTSMPSPSDQPSTVTFPSAPTRTFEVSQTPIRAGDGRTHGYTVSIKDVTRQRRRQQRLEVLNRVLRHNLRNDMTVIEGNASHIAERVDGDDGTPQRADGSGDRAVKERDEVGHASELILERSRALRRTADKARHVAQIAPDDAVARRHVDLGALVDRLVEEARSEYPEATIEVSTAEELVAETDPSTMRLVLENLIENAVVHNDTDHPTVELEVSDGPSDDRDAVVVQVRDDGPGIPDHELDVIETGSEDQLKHGSGLGLWIVTWAVEDLGGEIAFDTDDGTTVTVTLPDRDGDGR